mgnify:CR=1 FL=1
MSLFTNLATTVTARVERSTGYACGYCGQSYDEDHLNCLACGVDAVAPRG